jgi:hypothetical protein
LQEILESESSSSGQKEEIRDLLEAQSQFRSFL